MSFLPFSVDLSCKHIIMHNIMVLKYIVFLNTVWNYINKYLIYLVLQHNN